MKYLFKGAFKQYARTITKPTSFASISNEWSSSIVNKWDNFIIFPVQEMNLILYSCN